MSGCDLPGLVADTAQIDARPVLSRCRVTGPLVLTRAQINGDLDLRDMVITCPDEARTVLLAEQRHRRTTLSPYTRASGHIQDAAVGHGYRPARAGLWLMALLVCGALFFGLHPPAPLEAGKAPDFNAVFCTLDLLVPIITFGQGGAFAPRESGQWPAYGLIAAGWVLATTVTAGVSRAISRQ